MYFYFPVREHYEYTLQLEYYNHIKIKAMASHNQLPVTAAILDQKKMREFFVNVSKGFLKAQSHLIVIER